MNSCTSIASAVTDQLDDANGIKSGPLFVSKLVKQIGLCLEYTVYIGKYQFVLDSVLASSSSTIYIGLKAWNCSISRVSSQGYWKMHGCITGPISFGRQLNSIALYVNRRGILPVTYEAHCQRRFAPQFSHATHLRYPYLVHGTVCTGVYVSRSNHPRYVLTPYMFV
ncbi:hypothetical protein V6N13_015569 [Hibiscus sabdariffa]